MRVKIRAAAIVAGLVLSAGIPPAAAQSLGDVAKKEEARRKGIKEPAKVYTNDDLKPVADSTPPDTAQPSAAKPAETKPEDKDKDKDKEPAKDQAYWAGRKKDLQTQLDRDQTFAEALQSRINALTADFTARDDPAQRAVIERDRQKSLAELDRVKKSIEDDKKALSDLDEEARRAGVPPGWLR